MHRARVALLRLSRGRGLLVVRFRRRRVPQPAVFRVRVLTFCLRRNAMGCSVTAMFRFPLLRRLRFGPRRNPQHLVRSRARFQGSILLARSRIFSGRLRKPACAACGAEIVKFPCMLCFCRRLLRLNTHAANWIAFHGSSYLAVSSVSLFSRLNCFPVSLFPVCLSVFFLASSFIASEGFLSLLPYFIASLLHRAVSYLRCV